MFHLSAGHSQQPTQSCGLFRAKAHDEDVGGLESLFMMGELCHQSAPRMVKDKHHEPVHAGSKGIAAYLDYSLLYPLRHPDFLRKSCSGGLPYGALGREGISSRERGRVVGVIRVAEPGATHSQVSFSLFPWALSERLPKQPARRPARWRDGTVVNGLGRFPALRTIVLIVANSSPDSVLEAFRRKSGGRSPAPLASPPGAAPLARSCGSSRTEQDCYRND